MTNTPDELAAHELRDRPVEAARLYEIAISGGAATVDDYVNLTVICVASQDPGYAAKHSLSREFCSNAFDKVVKIAAMFAGQNAEVEFWSEYMDYIALGELPNEKRWQQMLSDGQSNVPAIYFAAVSDDTMIEEAKRRLSKEVLDGKTIRERYIQSFLPRR